MIQIIYGAFTAGLKAGHFWNSYPLINGEYFPEGIFRLSTFWHNLLYDSKTIQIIHRNLGLLYILSVFIFSYKMFSNNQNSVVYYNLVVMIVVIFLQFILGILTLITGASIFLALFHQLFAIISFLSLLKLKHSLRYN
tara:strand:- start:289 stop:702 length:414 start_codon:yes stop_codon:yes gene_type:complete